MAQNVQPLSLGRARGADAASGATDGATTGHKVRGGDSSKKAALEAMLAEAAAAPDLLLARRRTCVVTPLPGFGSFDAWPSILYRSASKWTHQKLSPECHVRRLGDRPLRRERTQPGDAEIGRGDRVAASALAAAHGVGGTFGRRAAVTGAVANATAHAVRGITRLAGARVTASAHSASPSIAPTVVGARATTSAHLGTAAESAHDTMLTTTSGQIVDAARNVWTLIAATGGAADFQIAVNGVRQTITGAVTLIKYYNPTGPAKAGTTKRSVVQRNSFVDCYMSTGVSSDNIASWVRLTGDPDVVSPPSGGGPTPPPQAIAAGFTTNVLNSDFDSPSEISDWGAANIAPWYTGGSETRFCNLSDLSVHDSMVSFLSGGAPYAASIGTTRGQGAPVSRPGAPVTNTGLGKRYEQGYFEAKMRVNSRPGPGWPGWWGTPDNFPGVDHLEIDFMESQSASSFNAGFLEWFGGQTPGQPFGDFFGSLGATGYPNWGTVISNSGIDTSGGWNVFGFLWTATYIEFYWNSWARRQAGIADYRHAHYPLNSGINGFISNNFRRPLNNFILKPKPLFLMLAAAGCDVDWVHVWQ